MATKKGSRKPFTEAEVVALSTLSKRIRAICKMEGVPVGALEAMANVSQPAIRGVQTGKRNFNVVNLLRMMEVLGYEIVLAKRTDARQISQDPDAMLKISQFKTQQLNAKRKERGQPEGRLPTKVRVRKSKVGENTLLIHSRRDILKSAEGANDIFNTD